MITPPFLLINDDRELFATEVVDRFTSEITIRSLRAVQDEVGKKIHVLGENASDFKSQQVHGFIEETEIEVTYVPRGQPDLNPTEEGWRQLKQFLDNRFFARSTNSDRQFPPHSTKLIDLRLPITSVVQWSNSGK